MANGQDSRRKTMRCVECVHCLWPNAGAAVSQEKIPEQRRNASFPEKLSPANANKRAS